VLVPSTEFNGQALGTSASTSCSVRLVSVAPLSGMPAATLNPAADTAATTEEGSGSFIPIQCLPFGAVIIKVR
jgi:hypothetical protein